MKAANILADHRQHAAHPHQPPVRPDANVWIKSERANPGASIKDRIALAMVEDGRGKRASSARAARSSSPRPATPASASRWSRRSRATSCILVMPDSMSVERRRLMLAYGAQLVLTPRPKGMKGSIAKANEILAATPGGMDAAAVREPRERRGAHAHDREGDPRRFPEGLDALITGVGTGGHITGCARVLKKHGRS